MLPIYIRNIPIYEYYQIGPQVKTGNNEGDSTVLAWIKPKLVVFVYATKPRI